MDAEDKNYERVTTKVIRILALRIDKLTKKLTFGVFQEKLDTYIKKELTHATNVVCVVKHMEDPKISFDNNSKSKDLTEEESNPSMNKMIQD